MTVDTGVRHQPYFSIRTTDNISLRNQCGQVTLSKNSHYCSWYGSIMMTPDMMGEAIALAVSRQCGRKGLDAASLAQLVSCDVEVIHRLLRGDFEECFALRERYTTKTSLQRQICDAIGLSPRNCIELDTSVIF